MTQPSLDAAPSVRPFGDGAVLIEPTADEGRVLASDPAASTRWVLGFAREARRAWPGALVVPGLRSVLLVLGSGSAPASVDEVRDVLAESGRAGDQAPDGPGRIHRIPVRYDGPDLPATARLLGVPALEVVQRHAAAEWTVAAIGFSPGFGYLTASDSIFGQVPRLDQPRARVLAGSVALAAGMCAVYPSATPGGWRIIGSTDMRLFDVDADPPAVLAVGDRVRFVGAP